MFYDFTICKYILQFVLNALLKNKVRQIRHPSLMMRMRTDFQMMTRSKMIVKVKTTRDTTSLKTKVKKGGCGHERSI